MVSAGMTRFNLNILGKRLRSLMVTLPSIAIMGIFLAAGFAPAQDAPNQQANSQKNAPIYGIDLRNDPSWMDDSSTNSTLDQIWGALQPGGYNMLRISIDLRDASSATSRAVRLCSWAQNNNVKLIFVLTGEDPGQALPQDYPKLVSEFVKKLIRQLQSAGGQSQASYAQIMALQIDDELNHPGKHAGKSVTVEKILEMAKSLHKAQAEALNGTGLQAIPIVASASFDFPLIQARAIAGVPLTDAAYEKSYKNLKQFLASLAASPDIDFLAIDWFAGSISAGTAERFQPLVEKFTADIPGKPILFTTGFSSAFNTPDKQQSFATNYAGLANYCASRGGECRLAGTIFHEAVNPAMAGSDSQIAALAAELQKWDWPSKAADLAAMWTKGKDSEDLKRWLAAVENSMGLITLQAASSQASTPAPDAAGGGSTSGGSNGQPPSGLPATLPGSQTACPPQPDPAQSAGTQQAAPGNCQPYASGLKAVMTSLFGKIVNQLGDQAVPLLLGSRPSNAAGAQQFTSDPFSKSNPSPNSNQQATQPFGAQAGNTFVTPGDTSVTNPGNGQPAKSDSTQPATQSTGAPAQSQALATQQQPNSTGAANTPGQAQISQAQGPPPSGGANGAGGSSTGQGINSPGQPPSTSINGAALIVGGSGVSSAAAMQSLVSDSNNKQGVVGTPPLPTPLGQPQISQTSGQLSAGQVANGADSAQAPVTPATAALPRTVIIVTNSLATSGPTPKPTPTPALAASVLPPSKLYPPVNPPPVALDVKVVGPVSTAQLRGGQTVTFAATATNLGPQPVNAQARFVLSGPGTQVQSQTARFSATSLALWTVMLPRANGQMILTVTVIDAQGRNLANHTNKLQIK